MPATVSVTKMLKALAIDHEMGLWRQVVPQTPEIFGPFLAGRSQPLVFAR